VRQVQPAFFPSLPNQILPRHFEKLNSNEEKQIPKKIIQKTKNVHNDNKKFSF